MGQRFFLSEPINGILVHIRQLGLDHRAVTHKNFLVIQDKQDEIEEVVITRTDAASAAVADAAEAASGQLGVHYTTNGQLGVHYTTNTANAASAATGLLSVHYTTGTDWDWASTMMDDLFNQAYEEEEIEPPVTSPPPLLLPASSDPPKVQRHQEVNIF